MGISLGFTSRAALLLLLALPLVVVLARRSLAGRAAGAAREGRWALRGGALLGAAGLAAFLWTGAWPAALWGRAAAWCLTATGAVLFLLGAFARRLEAALLLRSAVVALLALALAGTRLLRENERVAVIFAVDHSDSIPRGRREEIRRWVAGQLHRLDRRRGDRAGVVVFGREAGIEMAPSTAPGELEGYATLVDPRATNLQAAVQLAAAAFPEDAGVRRLVIVSDGNENTGRALDEVRAAREQGVTVDVVPVEYTYSAEMWIERLLLEPVIEAGQPFSVQVVAGSTGEGEARFRLFENRQLLAGEGEARPLRAGRSFLEFRGLRRDQPGTYTYEVELEPVDPAGDTLVENNRAGAFARVEGESRVLLCTADPELEQPLAGALRSERIAVDVFTPPLLPRRLEEYLDYQAIVVSNVSAAALGEERMELLEVLVKGAGVGFVMAGGREAFGAGGYKGTPVERLLPVAMDLEGTRVLPNGALAMVVHSCELPQGNTWAGKIVERAIRVLSPRDYAGVIYFDAVAQEKWLFPMLPCSRRDLMLEELRGFSPGDMMSFQTILKNAFDALAATPASLKHIVVLSDGDPSPPDGDLVRAITGAGITISTVCYGAHGAIPPLMEELATAGGGRFYYLRNESDLPEIFIREAAEVRKSLIVEETFVPELHSPGPALRGLGEVPALDGLVLASPKPLAEVLLVRRPPEGEAPADPLLATWRYGLGKAAAFTSDTGARWAGRWTSWPGYQRFWSQLVRWVSRAEEGGPLRASRQLDGERARVVIDAVDAAGRLLDGLEFEGSIVTPDRESRAVAPRQVGPGRYEVEFPVAGAGTYALTLRYRHGGEERIFTTGVAVPYSPEHRRLSANRELLRRLAEAGGGRYVEGAAAGFFTPGAERGYAVRGIWRELVILALVLFTLDVFVRRVEVDRGAVRAGVVRLFARLPPRRPAAEAPAVAPQLEALLERKARAGRERAAGAHPAPETPERPAEAAAGPVARVAAPPGAARPPDEAAERSFTERLLEAKRRAVRPGGGEHSERGSEEGGRARPPTRPLRPAAGEEETTDPRAREDP